METRDFLKYFVRGCRYCVNVCEIFSCYRYSHRCFFTDKIYKEKKIKQPLTVHSPTTLLCFPITKSQNLKLYFLTFLFSVYFQIMFWHLYFQTVIWIILYGILFEAQMNTLFQNIKHSFALKGSKTHLGNWIWLSIKTL